MNYNEVIKGLSANRNVYYEILSGLTEEIYLWKPAPDKWCLLEIVCHLYDEEREDFRARIMHILETPTEPLPPIDPQGWVKSRNYVQQNYSESLNNFLIERERSVKLLKAISNPNWNNAYQHPKFGKMTAKMFLSNWLAHDFLHFRQIVKLKYDYLKQMTEEDLNYAGNW
ncbi:MAG: DinB family protein [Saprospiraceae bacterium]